MLRYCLYGIKQYSINHKFCIFSWKFILSNRNLFFKRVFSVFICFMEHWCNKAFKYKTKRHEWCLNNFYFNSQEKTKKEYQNYFQWNVLVGREVPNPHRLFGVFSYHSRIFHSYGDVTIAGEGLQIWTYARHSWPLSSEGSLACHTCCGTGHLIIMVISKDPWHSHLLPSVWQWSCHYMFLRLRSVAAGIRTPNLPLARRTL